MPDISLIIPTYNRPADLAVCLESVCRQSLLPDEVIVIDDGALDSVPLSMQLEKLNITLKYFRKDSPGLTASRNKGVEMAEGKIIFFLDDDVKLLPDYIEKITAVFNTDQSIGGVAGQIVNTKPVTGTRLVLYWLECLFMISGRSEGRVLKSGFCVNYGETPRSNLHLSRVDFLPGGVSAYRREVFDSFSFSTEYRGYGQGEDKDFSLRVGRSFKMFFTPEAKLYHYESPQMRFDQFNKGKEYVLGRYRFFKDYLGTRGTPSFFFFYALFGYFIKRMIIFAASKEKKEQWQRLKGMTAALGTIISREKNG